MKSNVVLVVVLVFEPKGLTVTIQYNTIKVGTH